MVVGAGLAAAGGAFGVDMVFFGNPFVSVVVGAGLGAGGGLGEALVPSCVFSVRLGSSIVPRLSDQVISCVDHLVLTYRERDVSHPLSQHLLYPQE